MTAIVTANFGGFDDFRPQMDQDIDVEWVAYTDNPDLKAPDPWMTVVVPASENPRLAAKVPKFLAAVASDVIWIDANMEVTARRFAREALSYRHDGIAVFRHPRRNCIYTEAEASVGRESQGGKYDGEPIFEQVDHYRTEGHPAHYGLWACGTIAWDFRNPKAVRVGSDWLEECRRWSIQDQLSFPVVCRRLGVDPGEFPFRQIERHAPMWLENRWLRIHPHRVPVA